MICEAPNCSTDLAPLIAAGHLKSNAHCCSAACRAAKSRAKRQDPDAAASDEFWRGMHRITGRPHVDTPERIRARERRNAAGARVTAG